MCGIAGKLYEERDREVDQDLLRAMCRSMAHRGPDDEGFYANGGVGLCMRRLKVLDLEGGGQPMSNEDGSVWIVFNGEIYNYRQLRADLEGKGHVFRTASDTESILHLYEEKGLGCLAELSGMFAFAIWDAGRRRLILARDRVGKKPLYYAEGPSGLSFASDLGALLLDSELDRTIDYQAIDEYLTYLFIPHPRTPFRAIRKLPPASYAVYSEGSLDVKRYWSVTYDSPRNLGEKETADALEETLLSAVESRLEADVPVGAFLSGGLDSSLVVALMCRVSPSRVRTFSIGFEDSSFSELEQARTVADELGTDHEECIAEYGVEDLLPKLIEHFGEPFADSSAIPTYHVSRITRAHVTVALSGDGGDEVFGGYRRYQARRWADLFNRLPGPAGRWALERIIDSMHEPAIYFGQSFRKKSKRFVEFSRAVREAPETSWAFFLPPSEKTGLYAPEFSGALRTESSSPSLECYQEQMGRSGGDQAMPWLDLMSYLPDDILTKVDRMSMACSLEVRCPLLDHRVVEFMARVPRQLKFTSFESKRLLRRVAARFLPESTLSRPKHGFAVPLARWLQAELRPSAEGLLGSSRFHSRGLFARARVEEMMASHQSGRRDLSQQLWALMVLEMWFLRYAPTAGL